LACNAFEPNGEFHMGREVVAVTHWRGAVEEVKALLESDEIILRGAIRARLHRSGVTRAVIDDGNLIVDCDGEVLTLELGRSEAEKWLERLLLPPPSLARKLGISEVCRPFVIGPCTSPELNGALSDLTCQSPDEAHLLVAIIGSQSDLEQAHQIANQYPGYYLWCIYSKGKDSAFGDAAIRSYLRENGYIDSKSCAVSPQLTATRYRSRRP
jgi:hypothetical protein